MSPAAHHPPLRAVIDTHETVRKRGRRFQIPPLRLGSNAAFLTISARLLYRRPASAVLNREIRKHDCAEITQKLDARRAAQK